MNTGIQDSANLAWNLALVMNKADPKLLETYEEERRPIAQALVSATGVDTKAMYSESALVRWLRDKVISRLSSIDAISERIKNQIEMLSIAGWSVKTSQPAPPKKPSSSSTNYTSMPFSSKSVALLEECGDGGG